MAYNSLPFEQRRHYHLRTAKWLEAAAEQLLSDIKLIETTLKLWLYPMLAEHWMQFPGTEGAKNALKYLEESGRCYIEYSVPVVRSEEGGGRSEEGEGGGRGEV